MEEFAQIKQKDMDKDGKLKLSARTRYEGR
jgi:hypothetical protein